ncbi:hypothetical protein V3C99_008404 [Haemonchus contortus]|uniref:RING-type E3 ubiquitin transferase (cysteine targeting) n=1 Tax=Haemonchus contortus TaxID=6289 RepID=A0A7I4YNQ0_HAECO
MACESLRVEQVDAKILDGEYQQLLEQQLGQLIRELPITIGHTCERIRPEIQLLIDALIWTNRIYRGASPGQIEVDIAYKEYTRKKILLHFVFSKLLPYISERASSFLKNSTAIKLVSKAAAIMEMINIIHYLNFLCVGGHSTFVESLLKLRNWNMHLPTIGTINYDSQNRELMWHTFRDALLLLWPAIAIISTKWQTRTGNGVVQTMDVALKCGRCGQAAVAPMRSGGCGHVACYWCVMSRVPTESVRCATCGEETLQVTPVRGHAFL